MQACSASPLELSLLVESDSLKSGRVVISAQLTNNTEQAIRFLPWNTPFDQYVMGRIFDVVEVSSGSQLDYIGPLVKRRAPTGADFILLSPSKKVATSLDITSVYKFCSDKNYRVQLRVDTLFGPEYTPIEIDASSVVIELGDGFRVCEE